MSIHKEAHPFAGKKMKIKDDVKHFQYPEFGGSEITVKDWHDRVAGKSWMHCDGNPACMVYAMRAGASGLPTDNEVIYGKVGCYGSLVHVSELEEIDEDN